MREIRLKTLHQRLQTRTRDSISVSEDKNPLLKGVAVDSRRVKNGDLFIASRGEIVDSHTFISEVLNRGAAAILAEKWFADRIPNQVPVILAENTRGMVGVVASLFLDNPSAKLRMIGITGTNGKTTVAHCLWKILSISDGVTAGMLGTIANVLGNGGKEKPLTTTPGPLPMQIAFSDMVKSGARSCVMEVSSHGIVQERIAGVNFDAGVLTNIGSDHLDYHKTFEVYRSVKRCFFEGLGEKSFAVLNKSDPSFDYVSSKTHCKVIPYSLNGWPGLKRCGIEIADCITLKLRDNHGGLFVKTKTFGRHNAENLCASVCCARALDIPWDAIEEGLQDFSPPPGRLEEIPAPGFKVFVDYAHTADALSKVLESLNPVVSASGGRLILVFGCGGDRDRKKRPEMGKAALNGSDRVFLTNDNPRTEDPASIIDDVLEGMSGAGDTLTVEKDRGKAIQKAIFECRSGDLLLIAGKGHEDYQIIGDRRYHFDDSEVARNTIKKLEEREDASFQV